LQKKNPLFEVRRKVGKKVWLLFEVKGCDIKRVGIVAMEKRGKTRRNFAEVTNAFKNGMSFVVNVILQLAGYCFRRKVLLFAKGLGMIQWG